MSLSESCAKALSDKTYEKRKLAAQEVEKWETQFFQNFFIVTVIFSQDGAGIQQKQEQCTDKEAYRELFHSVLCVKRSKQA